MGGEAFQVQHLRAGVLDGMEQAALAAAGGAVDHAELQLQRQCGEDVDDEVPVGLVAAFDAPGVPADFAQDVRHRPGTLAPAPAVDQRPPGARHRGELVLYVVGDVLRHQRGAELLRVERGDLLVQRADPRTLLVVEHGRRDRARHVVLGVLGRGAHVDDRVEARQRFGRHGDERFGGGFHRAILRPSA